MASNDGAPPPIVNMFLEFALETDWLSNGVSLCSCWESNYKYLPSMVTSHLESFRCNFTLQVGDCRWPPQCRSGEMSIKLHSTSQTFPSSDSVLVVEPQDRGRAIHRDFDPELLALAATDTLAHVHWSSSLVVVGSG